MLLFQVIALIFLLFVIARLIIKFSRKQLSIKIFIFWFVFWLFVGLVIILPSTTEYLAKLLGIGRGVDLALYISTIIIFYLIFHFFLRQQKMEQEITKLTRRLALNEFNKKKASIDAPNKK